MATAKGAKGEAWPGEEAASSTFVSNLKHNRSLPALTTVLSGERVEKG